MIQLTMNFTFECKLLTKSVYCYSLDFGMDETKDITLAEDVIPEKLEMSHLNHNSRVTNASKCTSNCMFSEYIGINSPS